MKSKTSNKRAKLVAILLVLVMLISVGYAALETLLQISGTATLKKKTWNVHFANVQVKTGSVQATTAPEVPEGSTDTTSLTWAVNMDTPGQYYEFNVDVVNGGDLDAMVSTATNSIITSTLTEAQRAYLDYTIKYENGAEVEQYDALPAGETRTITVKLLFKQDINPNVLPGTNQTGLTLSYNANYVQADSNVNTQKQTQMQYAVTFKDDDGTTTLKTVPWIINPYDISGANSNVSAIPRHSPVDFISGPSIVSTSWSFSKENTGTFTATYLLFL